MASKIIPRESRSWDSVQEVAERLGCSQTSAYALVVGGTLRAAQLRPGSHWRVDRAAVDEMVARVHFGRNGASA
jgi:excisionase family DNA binding protein